MRAIGLEPAGDSAGYLQSVPLIEETMGERSRWILPPSPDAFNTTPADKRKTAYNVVGVIRGSDPVARDEAVIVGAHYDHIGIGRPVDGDSIYNGADDDASGCVAVLEAARAIASGRPPKRTLVFLLSTGEEIGLLGTNHYIANPVIPMARTVADLQVEMIGRPDSLAGGAGKGWLSGYGRSTMGEMFADGGIAIVADPRPAQNFFFRSDNIAFAFLGIPAHTLSSYNLHRDYHQPSDDVSKIDWAHMTGVIRAVAGAVRILGDGPAPRWKEGGDRRGGETSGPSVRPNGVRSVIHPPPRPTYPPPRRYGRLTPRPSGLWWRKPLHRS